MRGVDDVNALFAAAASEPTIALAVSGGADSLALMILAARWAARQGRPALVIYSVDHGLRVGSADEARMVLREAEKLGLSARSLRWDGEKPGTGVQEAARVARYRLMRDAMREDGATLLLTAHHLRDQAETVLMRLAHGSGPEGLRGMDRFSMVEGARVFRPLLGIDPQDLKAVVAKAGLTSAADPSNDDDHYERVRWRKALPMLEGFGLSVERLGTLSRRMGEVSDLLLALTDEAEHQLVSSADDETRLSVVGYLALRPAVATRLLARVLQQRTGLDRLAPLGAVETLRDALRDMAFPGGTLHGCVILRVDDTIVVRREKPRTSSVKACLKLTAN